VISLLFLVLALGVGFATYEFSPRAHAWVDEHVQALRGALAAHRAAEAHLDAAKGATAAVDSVAAVQHVYAATVANREAAQQTATAAKTAKTEAQRAAAAGSANVVVKREEKITTALASLGVGQCDVRSYTGVTPQIKNALLARIHNAGMTVTGDNPWDIETHQLDVKLRAVWDPQALLLKVIVTSGAGGYFGLVTCNAIWSKIDPLMKEISGR